MRIGIDARFYGPVGKGLGRYTQKLIENLEKIDDNLDGLNLTTNRIEMLERSELDRVDDHEVRIIKLEKAIVK